MNDTTEYINMLHGRNMHYIAQRDAILAMLKEGLPLAVGMDWKEQAQLLIDEIERK